MVRSSVIFSLCLFVFSCSKDQQPELIRFPDNFYVKMGYDTSQQKYFLLSGDSLYSRKNKLLIDSMVLERTPKGKDTFTVCVFKESYWDSFTRNDFGANGEPFGDEWESIWGYLNYSVIEFRKDTIYKKLLFNDLKLLNK